MLIQPCEAVLKFVDKLTLGCDIHPNFQQSIHIELENLRSSQHYCHLLSLAIIRLYYRLCSSPNGVLGRMAAKVL